MSTEYTDGSFSESAPLSEALGTFNGALESGTAKAFHVGTVEEIEEVKMMQTLSSRLDALKNEMAEMKAKQSDIIHTPTLKEKDIILGKYWREL